MENSAKDYSQPLLAYIAHSVKKLPEALELQREMTERGFPTVRSEQVDEVYNSPKEIAENRIHVLSNWRNRFFFFFIDASANDTVALIEFGYALNHTKKVCVIGKSRTNSFMYHPKVELYDTVDNFLYRNFFQ